MKNKQLDQFIKAVEDHSLGLNGVQLWQNGNKISEFNWSLPICQNVHSISKSIFATAIGIAIDEGLISLDERVKDMFPEYVNANNERQLGQLKVHHLLSMSSGQEKSYLMLEERNQIFQKNWVEFVLSQPFVNKPGEKFLYSNMGPYLAGVALQKKINMDLIEYLSPRLFEPLKMEVPYWERDRNGYTFAAGGIHLSIDSLAKIGQLYLQEGNWKGKQIFSSSWRKKATMSHIATNHKDNYSKSYGYSFWLGNEGVFRADGAYGQISLVIPKKRTVIATTAENADNKLILDEIFEKIYFDL